MEPLGKSFGSRGSQVQILVPRHSKSRSYEIKIVAPFLFASNLQTFSPPIWVHLVPFESIIFFLPFVEIFLAAFLFIEIPLSLPFPIGFFYDIAST